jgi:beta-galactosidase
MVRSGLGFLLALSLIVGCSTTRTPVGDECGAFPVGDEAIEDFFILSDTEAGEIEVRIWPAEGSQGLFEGATARVAFVCPDGSQRSLDGVGVNPGDHSPFAVTLPIDPVLTWSPSEPNLYEAFALLHSADGEPFASIEQRFGMRRLESREARFVVNGDPFFARVCAGEGGCGCDDLTRGEVETRLRAARRYGFNAVRHHSHVPNEMYMQVADEVGLFVQMEIHGRIGDDPSSERFQESVEAWEEMIRLGRRHPSTFIYSVGNEIYRNDPGLIEGQNILHDIAEEMDPSVLFLNRSGSSPLNDAFGEYDLIERPIGEYEHVGEFAREAFEVYLRGDRMGRSDEFPIIAHEYPLVASYPNPDLAHLHEETPPWLALTLENLRANGQEHLIPEYVRNSERIQAICRREMLEEARKFPELDGYSMLRFVDCGDYVSGVVNDFAEPKNVTADEFLRTNGETVLLCTWNERCLEYGDTLDALIEISHHGPVPFTASQCDWWLLDGPRLLASGSLDDIAVGAVDVAAVGRITLEIPELHHPAKLTLRVSLPDTVPHITNEWYLWAFPGDAVESDIQREVILWDPRGRMETYLGEYPDFVRTEDPEWTPSGDEALIITDSWQDSFYEFLQGGGNLWVISDKSWPWPEEMGIFGIHITRFVGSDQSPVVFPELDEHCNTWMTICSNHVSRHGQSGTLIADHPAMGDFPHEGFCDLDLWPMLYRAKVLQLDRFPAGTEPIIRAIDSYHRGQRKGYIVDLGVGEGACLISTLNMAQSFERSPATRHLFDQMLRYAVGDERLFSTEMTPDEVRTMVADFAVEHAERDPLIRDMMPARYAVRWRELLGEGELIPLIILDAEGIDEERLGVHCEYAQTQWYFNAQPGDSLAWPFETETEGEFAITLPMATPLAGLEIGVQVDDGEVMAAPVEGSEAWDHFAPVLVPLGSLAAGEHRLTLTVPEGVPMREGRSLQIRSPEIRGAEQE